jgi:hypothetical protein
VRWQEWLGRWDRRNQALISGEIPEEIRVRWRWNRSLDDRGRERLAIRSVVLDDDGVQTRLVRARAWPWEHIAFVTWEYTRNGSTLAVCLRGDPYVHSLNFSHRDARVCRALVDDCRSFVELHGVKAWSALDTGAMWWVNQPEAQRGR